MKFIETKIYTSAFGIEPVCGRLLNIGIEGFVIEDSEDFAAFLDDTEIYWDYVDEDLKAAKASSETNVTVYIPDDLEGLQTINQIRNSMDELHAGDTENLFGKLNVVTGDSIAEADWENNWKQYFKPFAVGDKFIIKPSWEVYDTPTDRMILEIDPASSFGTGSHDTTKLCICQLEKVVKGKEKLLDMGCGSGILSVAASMLGASEIVAVDIDRNAVKTTFENAEKNNVSLTGFDGNVLFDEELYQKIGKDYDIIVANIVADIIIEMTDMFKEKLKDDGILITSGIIDMRRDEVKTALLDAGFKLLLEQDSADWVAFTFKK